MPRWYNGQGCQGIEEAQASRLGGLVALLACVPRKSTKTARAGRVVVTRAATEDEGLHPGWMHESWGFRKWWRQWRTLRNLTNYIGGLKDVLKFVDLQIMEAQDFTYSFHSCCGISRIFPQRCFGNQQHLGSFGSGAETSESDLGDLDEWDGRCEAGLGLWIETGGSGCFVVGLCHVVSFGEGYEQSSKASTDAFCTHMVIWHDWQQDNHSLNLSHFRIALKLESLRKDFQPIGKRTWRYRTSPMTFRSSPKAWTSANCEVSWRSRISKLQMQKPEVSLFSRGGNGLGHRETPGNTEKFQVPKPHQVPFIHVPCVPMLFWHRCLGLRVILGHVGSMAVPNHQPSNSLIKRIKGKYLPATQRTVAV